MEAAIKAPSIRVSGSLISVIRTVTMGPVDAVDRALRACSTLPHAKCPYGKLNVDIVRGHKSMLLSEQEGSVTGLWVCLLLSYQRNSVRVVNG